MNAADELLLSESRASYSQFFLGIGRASRQKWRDEMTGELFGITEYLKCEGLLRSGSLWRRSYRADAAARVLADRHYNRQKVGAAQFVPPGSCFVLLSECRRAVWVTSWPKAAYVRHAWPGAWVNSLFRREGGPRASDLIRAAVAHTRAFYGEPPALGMVSFVDPKHVPPVKRRLPAMKKRGEHYFQLEGKTEIYGYCYLLAGFKHVGYTKGGLWAWQMLPHKMPAPELCEGLLSKDFEYLSRCEAAIRQAAEAWRAC